MKTFLKNYTSDAPVSQTIYRIEQVLIRCGVVSLPVGVSIWNVMAMMSPLLPGAYSFMMPDNRLREGGLKGLLPERTEP